MHAAPRRFTGYGFDLKFEHHAELLARRPKVDWVEVISDRFLTRGEHRRLPLLEQVRAAYPLALHGVGMSLGSAEPLDRAYLRALRELVRAVDPVYVSDHLAWSSFAGSELDLMPLPWTEEVLAHVAARVREAQDFLGCRLLVENPSSYLALCGSTMRECDFLAALAERADCGILLDVNNVYVTATNHGFDAGEYVRALPPERVEQMHVAGHDDAGDLLLDTHRGPVPEPVWDLYRLAVEHCGPRATIVEWDTDVPALDVLVAEAQRSATMAARARGPAPLRRAA